MRRVLALFGLLALAAVVALPAAAKSGDGPGKQAKPGKHGKQGDRGRHGPPSWARRHGRKCGKEIRRGEDRGYEVIFDGSRKCFARWEYTGGASATLQRDGTIRTGGGDPGLGVLWYAERPYGDFSLKLEFRDDAPEEGARANSGVQVRFPAPIGPVPGCPTTFNGNEQNNDAWIAVNCGHEVQINDSPTGDPRKTGSIYGFADLGIEEANPVPKGVWSELRIDVIGQTYRVYRDGELINEFENVDGLPFPGRPNDPGSESRDLVGYLGLQAHGSPNDVVSFRNIRVKDLTPR